MFRCSFFIYLLLVGCASQIKKEQTQLRTNFSQKKYKASLKLLDNSALKKDSNSKLLQLMERGRLQLAIGENLNASKTFEEAIQVSEELYGKSLSQELKNTFTKRYEKYFGEYFERSMIYYYQTLSYLQLSQTNCYKLKKKNICQTPQELNLWKSRARATLLLWDSTLQGMAREENYDTLFVKDIWNRIFAALVHEYIGDSQDLSIALNLYKEARDSITKVGMTYKIYNKKFIELSNEIRKLNYNVDNLEWKSFIENNLALQDIINFLNEKMVQILKRKNQLYPQEIQRLGLPREMVKNAKKDQPNIYLIVEEGLITPKIDKTISYNLRTAIDEMEDGTSKNLIRGIGVPILTYFALGPLGLGHYSQSGNTSIYVHHNAGNVLVEEVGIEYGISTIEPSQDPKNLELKIESLNENSENQILNLPIAGSLSDLAYQNLVEKNSKEGLKNGSRIAIKYAVAILAAFSTYNSLRGSRGENEFWAKTAALAQFVASTKVIRETERPDVRFWSTLPSFMRAQSLYLSPGKYKLSIQKTEQKSQKKLKTKKLMTMELTVEEGKRYIFPVILPNL
jgi:hypothetical protein